jgi:hypothetical protein
LPIDSDCPCGDRAHLCTGLLAKGMHLFANFFSQGWRSLVPPSSSHSTSASSSLLGSTVPKSPVGFPKSAKPSARSPGLSSASGAGTGRAVASWLGVSQQMLQGVTQAVAQPSAVLASGY